MVVKLACALTAGVCVAVAAVTSATPTVVLVSVTLAVLEPVVVPVALLNVPCVVVKLTATPEPTGLPLASTTLANSVILVVPSSITLGGLGVKVDTTAVA